MGHIRHDAIIVTHGDRKCVEESKEKANDLGLTTTSIETTINGYSSYMIVPDGSKEGWDGSNKAEEARRLWKESGGGDWVHIRFGGDEDEAYIVDLS